MAHMCVCVCVCVCVFSFHYLAIAFCQLTIKRIYYVTVCYL